MKPPSIRVATVAACAAQFLPPGSSVHAQTTPAASTSAASSLADTDRKLVEAASMAGSAEIDAARLALHQSNARV